MNHRASLWLECVTIFLLLPIVVTLMANVVRPIPVLFVLTVVAAIVLWRDPTFDRKQILRTDGLAGHLRGVLMLWSVAAVALAGLMYVLEPRALFSFPLNRPRLWVMVMLLYPIFSVVPQTIIYRAYFFHRYRSIFPTSTMMILAAAVAFCAGHVIFKNGVALALTFAGGLIFSWRFLQTRSLLLSAIEHALYGQLLFTLGYGIFLFHGRMQVMQQLNAN
jgi:uncharacterized protein